jgi:uncharacterized protein YhhL (DUF1145 family)
MFLVIAVMRGGLLAFWLLFIVNTLMPLSGNWGGGVMAVGSVIMALHLAELAVVYQRLALIGRAGRRDVIGVLLFGVLHWRPLLRYSSGAQQQDHSTDNENL